ncbi:sensor histidine kinase [Methanosarcina sp.]|uniref:sensor histidine kinase n=1 Tax=Methanosarcina sp. TaxID=2213 RepID=UPI002989847F|nr:PAS domain-containing protein [Methanosarcina sp.]MDW5550309.1 PAS domain-containing protein [Methanosarcina sp.]MDW5554137.1 PAS domain-containing protein [Methanosarcina sp.]MDW5560332.1 PAS domain-containing protein [Methanosarcina sp.]
MEGNFYKENLEKVAERFFSIADQTGQLIFDGDPKTGKIEWYGAIEEITGYTPEEFSKVDLEGCKDLVHPEELEAFWSKLENSLETGKKFEQKFRFKRKDGSYIYVDQSSVFLKDENNYVYRAIGLIKNITEMKHDQEKLKISEENLLRYLQNFRGIGFQMDINFDFVLLHGAVKEITGYEDKDFYSGIIQLAQLVDPEDRSNFFENRSKLSIVSNYIIEQEYRIRNRNGNRVWVFESVQVIHSIDQTNRLYQGFIQDITERKIAKETLDRAEKFRKKEIHHRIKNNLQVISSLLDLECDNLLSGTLDHKKIVEAFRESHNRIISMSVIHEELYNSKDMETINFASYLKKLTDDLFKSYKVGNSDIKLNLDAEDFFLEMDNAIPLGIIVNELVSNSLKYAFPGRRNGEIYVKLQTLHDEDKKLSSATVDFNIQNNLCNCRYFMLTIGDDGIGFPESFDFKNTGSLGLQLVNTLVDQIGGNIKIENGPGTRYKILFKDS